MNPYLITEPTCISFSGRQAVAEAEKQEPVAWMDSTGFIYKIKPEPPWPEVQPLKPLYTHPPKREWVGLIKGVRVDGDNVVISAKGGNDAARKLCAELLREKNGGGQ